MKKNKILIVNDSEAVCVYIDLMLKASGYDTHVAEDGVEAMRILNENQFDLIITDLNMPHMDGVELTRQVRQHADYRFLPVIFLSAGDQEALQEQGRKVGSSAFIGFPFQKEKLLKIIRSLIR